MNRLRAKGIDKYGNLYYVTVYDGKVQAYFQTGSAHDLGNICKGGDCMPLKFALEESRTDSDVVRALGAHSKLEKIEAVRP